MFKNNLINLISSELAKSAYKFSILIVDNIAYEVITSLIGINDLNSLNISLIINISNQSIDSELHNINAIVILSSKSLIEKCKEKNIISNIINDTLFENMYLYLIDELSDENSKIFMESFKDNQNKLSIIKSFYSLNYNFTSIDNLIEYSEPSKLQKFNDSILTFNTDLFNKHSSLCFQEIIKKSMTDELDDKLLANQFENLANNMVCFFKNMKLIPIFRFESKSQFLHTLVKLISEKLLNEPISSQNNSIEFIMFDRFQNLKNITPIFAFPSSQRGVLFDISKTQTNTVSQNNKQDKVQNYDNIWKENKNLDIIDFKENIDKVIVSTDKNTNQNSNSEKNLQLSIEQELENKEKILNSSRHLEQFESILKQNNEHNIGAAQDYFDKLIVDQNEINIIKEDDSLDDLSKIRLYLTQISVQLKIDDEFAIRQKMKLKCETNKKLFSLILEWVKSCYSSNFEQKSSSQFDLIQTKFNKKVISKIMDNALNQNKVSGMRVEKIEEVKLPSISNKMIVFVFGGICIHEYEEFIKFKEGMDIIYSGTEIIQQENFIKMFN